MRRPLRPEPLHMCGGCDRPFVVPVSVVDLLDDRRAVVELSCKNCGRTVLGVHDDTSLAELDRALDATTDSMRQALELMAFADDMERIDVFARALRDDLILPEDF